MRLAREAVRVEGAMRSWMRGRGTKAEVEGVFCPQCGCRIYHAWLGSETLNIKPGTLDDTRWLQPVGHIWTASRQAGAWIDPDLIAYERQPASEEALMAAWREALRR
jgi:hypothetical protein